MKVIQWLLILLPISGKTQTTGINWTEAQSWEKVKEIAKVKNKYIFVDVYATWCGPCKMMDQNVYSNDTVGRVFNADFISIKVQMDQTGRDNDHTKAWYKDAEYLKEQYKPDGYPSYLFFSPDGKLAHKDVGYLPVIKFVSTAEKALTNPIATYENNISKFKQGQSDYPQLGVLAIETQKKRDRDLAIEIATVYKQKHLDLLEAGPAFSTDNLYFISRFSYYLIDSKDRYFNFFRMNAKYADSLLKQRGKSDFIVRNVIIKDEITKRVYPEDGKPVPDPNWKKITKSINSRYNDVVNARQIVLDEKINYYKNVKKWRLHFTYFIEKVETYGIKSLGLGYCNTISSSFKHCHDSVLLSKAIGWVEGRILQSDILHFATLKLITQNELKGPTLSYSNDFTNYAALLYNLGRKTDAIRWVELHIKLLEIASDPNVPFFSNDLRKKNEILTLMKNDKPIDDVENSWFF